VGFTETLRLIVAADTGKAVTNINAVGVATDKSLARSQKSIDKWSRGLTTAGAGMVALGGVALLGLGKAAMASEDANLAVVKLENTLGKMPKLAGENSKSFIDLADAIQGKTAADADQIVEAEAMLGTFQLTGDEIRKITPLVVDYSRKFGVDMVDASVQVGKALDGNVGALKRNGVSIDEAAFAADRFTAVQSALREQVGGFAEAEGKTFAGSLERMKNQLGDLAEGVGGGAVDAFTTMFGAVDSVTGALEKLSPGAQNALGKFATFGSVALIAAGGASFMVGQLLQMQQRFGDAAVAARGLIGNIGGVGRAARVAGGLVAVGIVAELIHLNNQRFPGITKIPRDVEKITDALRKVKDASPSNAKAFETFTLEVGNLDEALEKLLETSPGLASSLIDTAEKFGIPAEKIAEMRDRVEEYRQQAIETKGANEEWNASLEETAGAADEAASALQEYVDQLAAMTDPIFGAMDAIQGVRDAQIAEADAAVAVMEAQAALNEVRAGGNADEIAEAERTLADAQRDLTDAQWNTVESATEADSALAGLQDAVERGDVSVSDFKDTLRIWVAQGFLTKEQADRAAKSVGGLAGAAEEADKKRVVIPVSTPGSPRSRTELRRVRDAAHNIPRRTSTRVGVSGAAAAISLLNSVSTRIRQLDGSTATVRVNARMTSTGRIGGVPVFQHGGVADWQRGEHRLAAIAGGETVLPTHQPGFNLGGGGGGTTVVHNHFDLRGSMIADRDGFVRDISQAVNKGYRLGLINRTR
jgi:hypothetical protein